MGYSIGELTLSSRDEMWYGEIAILSSPTQKLSALFKIWEEIEKQTLQMATYTATQVFLRQFLPHSPPPKWLCPPEMAMMNFSPLNFRKS